MIAADAEAITTCNTSSAPYGAPPRASGISNAYHSPGVPPWRKKLQKSDSLASRAASQASASSRQGSWCAATKATIAMYTTRRISATHRGSGSRETSSLILLPSALYLKLAASMGRKSRRKSAATAKTPVRAEAATQRHNLPIIIGLAVLTFAVFGQVVSHNF